MLIFVYLNMMKWYLLKTKASPNGHWMWLQQENQQWAKPNWKSTFSKEIHFFKNKKNLLPQNNAPANYGKVRPKTGFGMLWLSRLMASRLKYGSFGWIWLWRELEKVRIGKNKKDAVIKYSTIKKVILDLLWVILRCWGNSSILCQQNSDAL